MRTLWKYGNWLMAAVMGMGVVLLCAVSLAVARNCVFSADDFLSLAEYQQGCGLLSLLQMAFSHTVSVYFSHAGAYTSYFLGDVNIFVLAEGWLTLSQLMVLGIGLFQIMLILFILCWECSGCSSTVSPGRKYWAGAPDTTPICSLLPSDWRRQP